MVNFGKLLKKKESFLLSTYGLLVTQLIVTFAIVYAYRNNPVVNKITRQSLLLYFALTFGIILIISFIAMPIWLKLILFTIFAIVIGGMLHNVSVFIPIELINNALFGTIAIFIAMSIFAFVLAAMGIDLSWMLMIMLAALIGLIIASLIVMFFATKSSKLNKAILVIGLVIFSIFVIVYTNTILQPNYHESFVDAALNFYLDFINIFTRILALEE